ncbi:hypothetical protein J437_LFUL009350 [Ladona fulva]|uniref:Chitin-binding type-4 domain-containing protein n=1 Tax=Ladona fulva TaxID=123851 RepID=A0A8K0NXW1_LADFU|nr:hypothetical protein J437_LFUL009350 [Ladona fulva]
MNPSASVGNSSMMIALTILVFLPCVFSHGYVIEPPNRASLWRLRIPGAIVDMEDNQLFCGGFQRQWNFNNGHCGLCGDDYSLPKPRPYENMGARSRGIVVKSYQEGDIIPVTVIITASHKGYFLFHLCKLVRDDDVETEECFKKNPLKVAGSRGYRYYLESWKPGNYTAKLQLPKGVTCERCVLRWHYTAGNSWGKCEDGTEAVGCGPQETFRTCSDIAIAPKDQLDKPKVSGFGHKLSQALGDVHRDDQRRKPRPQGEKKRTTLSVLKRVKMGIDVSSLRSLVFLALAFLPCVWGHGYLLKPVNRASLWRFNIPGAIVDYNDNQLFCGGFQVRFYFFANSCELTRVFCCSLGKKHFDLMLASRNPYGYQ